MMQSLLDVRGLKVVYQMREGFAEVFRDLSMHINRSEILGLVGESGCGKSSLAYVIMRLLPRNARVAEGRIIFDGEPLLEKTESEMKKIRGKKISMVFQDPMASLNPVFTVEQQVAKVIEIHENVSKSVANKKVAKLLKLVELADVDRVLKAYPHELSGGMQQRVMIAMALSLNPKLIIADEPTSSVDATIQMQILQLLMRLKEEIGFSILLITHNLSIVVKTCDRIAVMYAGEIVEEGPSSSVLSNPKHPYTRALVLSIPPLSLQVGERAQLSSIEGSAPDLLTIPSGCPFHPRCPSRMDICSSIVPRRIPVGSKHFASCHLNDRNGQNENNTLG